ncbi:hypothetical protein LTR78_008394 [Recurvomyces mirabilis]|uniref:Enoyl reductase (ER) domain-containing protein n=1 Tax=Recurvomyces mirabilis TaxID=574656 RepID=A0AAE0TQJ4_9PEZI|nr:hypothetical protein LTR78_008394 [Recurvomyces mirabilis]KAK5155381.1 hypothetical protein LTS14_005642 [Recurvomyces mirabilis]
MHQAQVEAWGSAPRYISVPDLPPPAEDEIRIKVLAAGVHQVVRSRASGKHYTSGTPPHIPGVDGIGETEDGKRVYWFSLDRGCFAEWVNMPKRNIRMLPEGTDPVQAAAVINPALSSWMAFQSRVNLPLPQGFSVLILGATLASGRVAVEIARGFGAGKVVGVARDRGKLGSVEGLDERIVVAEKVEETDFSKFGDVDVILDYVYGPLGAHCLASLMSRKPTSYVHIGMLSGQDLVLPGAVIRSKNLTIRGSGPGSWAMHEMAESIDGLLGLVKRIPKQPIKAAKLEDIETVWGEGVKEGRLVFVP